MKEIIELSTEAMILKTSRAQDKDLWNLSKKSGKVT